MQETIRKWLQTLALIVIGFAFLWANQTVNEQGRIKEQAIDSCQRNVADREIQQSGHRRLAQAWRVLSAAAENNTLVLEFNSAAERHAGLAKALDPLINIKCESKFE